MNGQTSPPSCSATPKSGPALKRRKWGIFDVAYEEPSPFSMLQACCTYQELLGGIATVWRMLGLLFTFNMMASLRYLTCHFWQSISPAISLLLAHLSLNLIAKELSSSDTTTMSANAQSYLLALVLIWLCCSFLSTFAYFETTEQEEVLGGHLRAHFLPLLGKDRMQQINSLPIDRDLSNRWMFPSASSYGYHIPMLDELRILVKGANDITTIISELFVLVIIASCLAPQRAEAELFATLGFCALFVFMFQPSNGTSGAEYVKASQELGPVRSNTLAMACWMPIPWYWKLATILTDSNLMAVYILASLIRGSLDAKSIAAMATLQYAAHLLSRAVISVKSGNLSLVGVLKRVDEYLEMSDPKLSVLPMDVTPPLPCGGPGLGVGIEFRDVVFNHSRLASGKKSSFSVSPGTLTLIIGSPGSGKSNLLKLATSLVRPAEGVVTVSGQQGDAIAREALLQRTVYLSHEDQVFPLSLMENIAIGMGGTEKVSVHSQVSKILSMPFFTHLQEKFNSGLALTKCALKDIIESSDDERQRIMAARALLRMQIDPDLVILDDVASKLGADDEAKLHDIFLNQRKEATVIIVSQRPGKLLGIADQILYVDSDMVVQQGTHIAMIGEAGPYRDWYSSQRGSLVEDPQRSLQAGFNLSPIS
ncbi:P-loop containing nucleoside triphosphate hydrolase protein [Coprinopsis sp. MPI-PUGE-AT-0042]|nr:P-loop containing nucleoside triphosphate hydrolase protein [Coprinopsis sp. MPI-PUGE-AT-0042]